MTDDGRRRYPDLPRDPARVQSDVDEEIQFDIDMRVRELVAQGIAFDAARERAVREFGNVEETRRYCSTLDVRAERDARRGAWFEELRVDLALAWRAMRRTPAFALVVLVTLALGIGANTAVFSVVRRILIDRLPYREADRLVRIYGGTTPSSGSSLMTPRELVDLATAPSFASVAAFGSLSSATYVGKDASEMWQSASVTPNFFAVLGVSARVGRTIGERDLSPDGPPSVVISYALWQRVFGGDSTAVGRVIDLGGRQRTIIGVMPSDFVSPTFTAEAWLPLDLRPMLGDRARANGAFRGIARLAGGASIERARADGATIANRWRDDRVGSPEPIPPQIVPLRDAMVGNIRAVLLAVMGAAILVLVITCINIAGLFLARATARRREIAVRAALGAGRGRLIRQLLTESAAYGVLGGALGIGLAFMVRDSLARIAMASLPNLGAIRIDAGMLATAVVVSVLSGLAFGLLPAIAATRVSLTDSLAASGRGASAGGSIARARHVLVTAQIALAVVLMVGAGLLLRSFAALVHTDLGYSSTKNVLAFSMQAPASVTGGQMGRNAFFADVLTRIHALPGVKSVGLTTIGPWNGPNGVRLKTAATANDPDGLRAIYMTATDEYFAAVGTAVTRGRSIRADDRPGAPPVVLISESIARRLFPGGDAIGSRVLFEAAGGSSTEKWREVIGVVADVRPYVTSDPSPAVYVSNWQEDGSRTPQFVVRVAERGDAALLIPALRQLVHEINPVSPLMFPRTLSDVLHKNIAPQEVSMTLFAAFAALALALAALGVYAVMAYLVAARTREFGIRSALGARRGSLVMLVLRQGILAAIVGCAAGLILAAVGARLIERLLSGVSTHDAVTFVAAPLVLFAVTLAACLIPARAATRVQPVDALRAE